MELKKGKLQVVKDSLQYAVLYAPTEEETSEFALLLVEVQVAIETEKFKRDTTNSSSSLPGCMFSRCDYHPQCKGSCKHPL